MYFDIDEEETPYDMCDWRASYHNINLESDDPLEQIIAHIVLQVKCNMQGLSETGESLFDPHGRLDARYLQDYANGNTAWKLYMECIGDEYNPFMRESVESVAWQFMYRETARIPQDILKKLFGRFGTEGFQYSSPTEKTTLSSQVAEPLMDYLYTLADRERTYM